jgi:RecJ-like exonuclease
MPAVACVTCIDPGNRSSAVKKLLLFIALALVLFGLPFIAYTAEDYVGAKKCKVCHMKIFKGWEQTKHAVAFEALKPGVAVDVKKKAGLDAQKDYTQDASCVGCHTTGTVDNPGIHCEACHGPGKQYSQATIMNKSKWKADPAKQCAMAVEAGLVLKPSAEHCTVCHNEKSPTFKPFDFEKRYPDVKHPE